MKKMQQNWNVFLYRKEMNRSRTKTPPKLATETLPALDASLSLSTDLHLSYSCRYSWMVLLSISVLFLEFFSILSLQRRYNSSPASKALQQSSDRPEQQLQLVWPVLQVSFLHSLNSPAKRASSKRSVLEQLTLAWRSWRLFFLGAFMLTQTVSKALKMKAIAILFIVEVFC